MTKLEELSPNIHHSSSVFMDFWRLFGYARTSFYSHVSPIDLPAKDSDKPINLLDFCKQITPVCRLNPLLFNGHLQTFWTAVKSYDIPIYYKRHLFSAEEPAFAGTFAVDFVVKAYQGADESLPPRTAYYGDAEFESVGSMDNRPMLVALHGLSGGSHEIYLRHVLSPLVDGGGWEACVVNSRGCAKSKITTGVLYNARATWDIRQVVKWLRKTFPNRPLFGIGFSLGANILVNVRIVHRAQLTVLHLIAWVCAVLR
jgi:predicted alpha/beta-fold hydrolase